MGLHSKVSGAPIMASPWRRRRMCILVSDQAAPAMLFAISATGATLETNARPAPGSPVELQHPEAGMIQGLVRSVSADGINITFALSEASMAFALAALTADMSRAA